MSGTKNELSQAPAAWHDELWVPSNARVAHALAALGQEPPEWRRAYQASREAEWAVVAASSIHLVAECDQRQADLVEAKARFERLPTAANRNAVVCCENRLAIATGILSAAPGEVGRLQVAAEREARKKDLREATAELSLQLVDVDGTPLIEKIAEDDAAIKRERAELQALQSKADQAKAGAIEMLCDAIDREIMKESRAVGSLLRGQGLAVAKTYPQLADRRILQAFRRAQDLARISFELDGQAIDVDQTFTRELNEEQYSAFAGIVYSRVSRFLSRVRSRR